MTRVLLAEDDASISEPLARALRREGYDVEVREDGPTALDAGLQGNIDLVVLDLGLPGMDGLEVCRRLRNEGHSFPILVLTARADEVDTVVGLDAGADDYVTKPFDGAVLVARIRAVLRRFGHASGPDDRAGAGTADGDGLAEAVLRFGDLEVDTEGMEVRKGGETVALTPTEMRLLLEFSTAPNTVLSRDRLLERVWDYGWGGDTRVVDVHVQRLRGKIGQDRIETVRGFGYKLRG